MTTTRDPITGQIFYDGNIRVFDGVTQVPRYPVVPQVNGVDTPGLLVDAGDGIPAIVRVVVNPGDDAVAATRLAAGGPYVTEIAPDSVEVIPVPADGSDGNITAVYVLVLSLAGTATAGVLDSSDIDSTADGSTSVGKPGVLGITKAQLLGATQVMVPMTFDDAQAVRHIEVKAGPLLGASSENIVIGVKGVRYE